jgi:hypothetical protein
MLELEFPNESHKKAHELLIKEWLQFEESTSPSKLFA